MGQLGGSGSQPGSLKHGLSAVGWGQPAVSWFRLALAGTTGASWLCPSRLAWPRSLGDCRGGREEAEVGKSFLEKSGLASHFLISYGPKRVPKKSWSLSPGVVQAIPPKGCKGTAKFYSRAHRLLREGRSVSTVVKTLLQSYSTNSFPHPTQIPFTPALTTVGQALAFHSPKSARW